MMVAKASIRQHLKRVNISLIDRQIPTIQLIVNFRFKIIFNRLIKISAKFQYEAEIQNLLVRKKGDDGEDGSDQKSVKAKQNTKRESSKKKKLKEIRKKRAN